MSLRRIDWTQIDSINVPVGNVIDIGKINGPIHAVYAENLFVSGTSIVDLINQNAVGITGGTYDSQTGTVTFINSTGGTFQISGFVTGMTDTYITGGTFTGGTLVLYDNMGNVINMSGSLSTDFVPISGGTMTGALYTPLVSATTIDIGETSYGLTKNSILGVIKQNGVTIYHSMGSNNLFLGKYSGNLDVTGGQNTSVGVSSLYSITTGYNNTSFGHLSLQINDEGYDNTSVGYSSLKNHINGYANVSIGSRSFYYNENGHNNVVIGTEAGFSNQYGSNNIFIGYQAGYYEYGSNRLWISNSADIPLIYGQFDNRRVSLNSTTSYATLDIYPYNNDQPLRVNGLTSVSSDLSVLTVDSNGDVHKQPNPNQKKLILNEINLCSKPYFDGMESFLNNIFNSQFSQSFGLYYDGIKIDYFFTINDFNTNKRKKILFTTQTIGFDFDSYLAFHEMINFMLNNNYTDYNINFYCEVYVNLDLGYSAPTQVKLINPLFSSLTPVKYSKTKNYKGFDKYVNGGYNDSTSITYKNTLFSQFDHFSNVYYIYSAELNLDTLPKKIYDIVNNNSFYGSLSEIAQTVLTSSGWTQTTLGLICDSVYVENINNFYKKFKIPTNQHNVLHNSTIHLNNFYGNIMYDMVSGSPVIVTGHSHSVIYDINNGYVTYKSPALLQFIDTFRVLPTGNVGMIYFDGMEKYTSSLSLSSNINISPYVKNVKYINNRVERYNSIIQVLPGYNDIYVLKVSVPSGTTTDGSYYFIKNLFEKYAIVGDSSVKKFNSHWHILAEQVQYDLTSQNSLDNSNYGPYILIQSNDNKMAELSNNNVFNTIEYEYYVGGSINGYLSSNSNYEFNNIIAINYDNSVDNRIYPGGNSSGFTGEIMTLLFEPTTNMLFVGGTFSSYYVEGQRNKIAKLNTLTGNLDLGFNGGIGNYGFNGQVNNIVKYDDNNILIGGIFSIYQDITGNFSYNGIIKLNSLDGSVDNSFLGGNGRGFNNYVNTIVVQPDGKILVGGNFNTFTDDQNTYNVGGIVRLLPNGRLDPTFNVKNYQFNDLIRVIVIQEDGKILIGGDFNYFGSHFCRYIIRLNENGVYDPTFIGDGYGFNDSVYTIELSKDFIFVGGVFTWFYNNLRSCNSNYIIKLKYDGDFDFNFSNGFDNVVRTIKYQESNEKLIVGGDFNSFNSQTIKNIVRIYYDKTSSNYIIDGSFLQGNSSYGLFNDRVNIISLKEVVNGSHQIDSIYKGYTFRPLLYPLNLTQLILEVPESFFFDGSDQQQINTYSDNNQFDIDPNNYGVFNKELRIIMKEIKTNKYNIIPTNLSYTRDNGNHYNKIFTLTIENENIEKLLFYNIPVKKRKLLKPGLVEFYFTFYDATTKKTSLIPNYKMIITNYGNNEIFKIVREGNNRNISSHNQVVN